MPPDSLLDLFRRTSVLRTRDLERHAIPRHRLAALKHKGVIRQLDRGLYVLADATGVTENHSVAVACKRVHGVVCLLTALRLHGLTTQAPFEVWIAIGRKDWLPTIHDLPIRIVRFSGAALSEGVERRIIEGVEVRLYNPAKTVADCFKYRNKIGLDVALEALRDFHRQKKGTMDELWQFANVCRVANVMRPYMEAIVSFP